LYFTTKPAPVYTFFQGLFFPDSTFSARKTPEFLYRVGCVASYKKLWRKSFMKSFWLVFGIPILMFGPAQSEGGTVTVCCTTSHCVKLTIDATGGPANWNQLLITRGTAPWGYIPRTSGENDIFQWEDVTGVYPNQSYTYTVEYYNNLARVDLVGEITADTPWGDHLWPNGWQWKTGDNMWPDPAWYKLDEHTVRGIGCVCCQPNNTHNDATCSISQTDSISVNDDSEKDTQYVSFTSPRGTYTNGCYDLVVHIHGHTDDGNSSSVLKVKVYANSSRQTLNIPLNIPKNAGWFPEAVFAESQLGGDWLANDLIDITVHLELDSMDSGENVTIDCIYLEVRDEPGLCLRCPQVCTPYFTFSNFCEGRLLFW
jgi:hypothetical protein